MQTFNEKKDILKKIILELEKQEKKRKEECSGFDPYLDFYIARKSGLIDAYKLIFDEEYND